jgi:DNA-binding NarL/FixJ family response regulator
MTHSDPLDDGLQRLAAVPAQTAAAAADPSVTAEPITVVIVDDHLMVAESLATVLGAEQDIVVLGIAATCAAGLAAIAMHNPDVLLLDQRLPEGLGTDLLPAIFRISPNLKVLMVTGGDSDDDLVRAITGGAAGLIPKGSRASTLINAVRAAANDEAVITPDAMRRLMPRLTNRITTLATDHLTNREREVLKMLTAGQGTDDIATDLCISPATTRNHIQSIMTKLNAHSRLEAVAIAARDNVLHEP